MHIDLIEGYIYLTSIMASFLIGRLTLRGHSQITIDRFSLVVLEIYSILQSVYATDATDTNAGQTQDHYRASTFRGKKSILFTRKSELFKDKCMSFDAKLIIGIGCLIVALYWFREY